MGAKVGGGGGGKYDLGQNAEINVTPFVDVMLVLLIIFMVSAPLLTVGVPVELPETEAGAVEDTSEPLTVTIRQDGTLFVQKDEASYEQLISRLTALGATGSEKPVFVRADGRAPYEMVARVMARLSSNGFTRLNLVTDTAAPSDLTLTPSQSAALAPPARP